MSQFPEFMCINNDEIDNSVYDLLQCETREAQKRQLKEVFKAYKVPEIPGEESRFEPIIEDILRSISVIQRSESWNMELVGSAELGIEYALEQPEIPFCHPYYICDDPSDLFITEENSCKNDPFYDEENGGIPCIFCDDCLAKRRGFCKYSVQDRDEEE